MSDNTKPNIMVLMSSYNGEKYIKEQIESILAQQGVQVSILLRDDESKDRTIQIVNELNSNRVQIVCGNNVGATNSFFELVEMCGKSEYYAFSDQDDLWDDDKLKIAINAIGKINGPAVYSSNTRLVDKNLKLIKEEAKHPNTTLASALMKDYATGCTIVFNSALMDILKSAIPKYAANHDWWVNLVVLSIGGVSIFDKEPHMSYRQHGNNVVGAPVSFLGKWKSRLYKFNNQLYRRDAMANELLELLDGKITADNRKVLNTFSNYKKNKLKILFNSNFKTGNKIDDFLFFVTVITNRI